MFPAAISQFTTSRWDLPDELSRCADHGFEALAVWRAKLSDVGLAAARRMFDDAGIRASSVQWAGGFTGGDGRSFAESVADAREAVDCAAALGAPVVVMHSGCRSGHTRSHARRLLLQAIDALAGHAGTNGVALAVKPLHPAVSVDCSFLTALDDALDLVEEATHRCAAVARIGLALDLWQFADDATFATLLPGLAEHALVVQVADRRGPPTGEQERLIAGQGGLPLHDAVAGLLRHGYRGDFEFDPVGEDVEARGYDTVLGDLRRVVDSWNFAVAADLGHGPLPEPLGLGRPARYRPRAGLGARKSHASSQTVSRG